MSSQRLSFKSHGLWHFVLAAPADEDVPLRELTRTLVAVSARHHWSCWTNGSQPLGWSRKLPRSKLEPGLRGARVGFCPADKWEQNGAEKRLPASAVRASAVRASAVQACIAPTERPPQAVFKSPGPQQPQSDTGSCWGHVGVRAGEEAPSLLLRKKQPPLVSTSSPDCLLLKELRSQAGNRK